MLHTIILSIPRRKLPEVEFLQLALYLILNEPVELDYFGLEPDNPADYLDDEMQLRIDSKTFINIYFEGDKMDYHLYSFAEVLAMATNLLIDPKEGTSVVADQKDITINLS